jgi:hypothetical protein
MQYTHDLNRGLALPPGGSYVDGGFLSALDMV